MYADCDSVLHLPACQRGEAIKWHLKHKQSADPPFQSSSMIRGVLASNVQVVYGIKGITYSLGTI